MNPSLDIGTIINKTFETWKGHLQTLVTAAVPVFAVSAILSLIVLSAGPKGLLLTPLLAIVSLIASAVYAGMVVRVVQAETQGTKPSFGELWPTVTPYILPLILTGFLVGLAVLVGLIFLIIPGIIIGVHLAVTGPVVVLEDKKYVEAMKRSWAIVKGNALNVFVIMFVMGLIVGIAGSILGMIGASAAGIAGHVVLRFVAEIFLAPLGGIAAASIYFQLAGSAAPAGSASAPSGGIPAAGVPGTAPAASGSVPPPPPSTAS